MKRYEPVLVLVLVIGSALFLLGVKTGWDSKDKLSRVEITRARNQANIATLDADLARKKVDGAKELIAKARDILDEAFLIRGSCNTVVSWYGEPFHGQESASGVLFDMNDRHIAHRGLPFGTRVVFYNPLNGAISWGDVVDRGPFVEGRVFDVSVRIAEELGIVDDGVAIVRSWVAEIPGELTLRGPGEED